MATLPPGGAQIGHLEALLEYKRCISQLFMGLYFGGRWVIATLPPGGSHICHQGCEKDGVAGREEGRWRMGKLMIVLYSTVQC